MCNKGVSVVVIGTVIMIGVKLEYTLVSCKCLRHTALCLWTIAQLSPKSFARRFFASVFQTLNSRIIDVAKFCWTEEVRMLKFVVAGGGGHLQ